MWDMGELCRCPACVGAVVKSVWVGGKDSIRIPRSRDHTRAVQMAAEEKGDPEGDVLHPWLCIHTRCWLTASMVRLQGVCLVVCLS